MKGKLMAYSLTAAVAIMAAAAAGILIQEVKRRRAV